MGPPLPESLLVQLSESGGSEESGEQGRGARSDGCQCQWTRTLLVSIRPGESDPPMTEAFRLFWLHTHTRVHTTPAPAPAPAPGPSHGGGVTGLGAPTALPAASLLGLGGWRLGAASLSLQVEVLLTVRDSESEDRLRVSGDPPKL
jgi:hypothetical protein